MPSNSPEYAKKYQSKPENKVRYNKLQNERRSENVNKNKQLVTVFKNQPCLDCKKQYPTECMDFDHVRGTKLMNISSMVHHKSAAAILAEIQKCEVVCANCHRIRTESRRRK